MLNVHSNIIIIITRNRYDALTLDGLVPVRRAEESDEGEEEDEKKSRTGRHKRT